MKYCLVILMLSAFCLSARATKYSCSSDPKLIEGIGDPHTIVYAFRFSFQYPLDQKTGCESAAIGAYAFEVWEAYNGFDKAMSDRNLLPGYPKQMELCQNFEKQIKLTDSNRPKKGLKGEGSLWSSNPKNPFHYSRFARVEFKGLMGELRVFEPTEVQGEHPILCHWLRR